MTNDRDALIDLGTASLETKGYVVGKDEHMGSLYVTAGISDD